MTRCILREGRKRENSSRGRVHLETVFDKASNEISVTVHEVLLSSRVRSQSTVIVHHADAVSSVNSMGISPGPTTNSSPSFQDDERPDSSDLEALPSITSRIIRCSEPGVPQIVTPTKHSQSVQFSGIPQDVMGGEVVKAICAKPIDIFIVADLRLESGKSVHKCQTKYYRGISPFSIEQTLSLNLDLQSQKTHQSARLCLEVWRRNRFSRDILKGCFSLPLSTLKENDKEGWFFLFDRYKGQRTFCRTVSPFYGSHQCASSSESSTKSFISCHSQESCLWRETVSEDTYNSCSEKERERQQAIWELIQSEMAYVQHLGEFLDAYPYERLIKCVSEEQYKEWFGVMDKFLMLARQLVSELHSKCTEGVVFNFGQVMLEHVRALEPYYTNYCTKNGDIGDSIAKHCDSNDSLASELSRGCSICGGLNVFSYRIKPMQRITKYPLLLESIVRHTPPDHHDFEATSEARHECLHIVDRINNAVRRAEWEKHLSSLDRCLQVPANLNPFCLSTPGASVFREYVFRPSTKLLGHRWLRNSLRGSSSPKRQVCSLTEKSHLFYSQQPHLTEDTPAGSIRVLFLVDDLIGPSLVITKVQATSEILLIPKVPTAMATIKELPCLSRKEDSSEGLRFKLKVTWLDNDHKQTTSTLELVTSHRSKLKQFMADLEEHKSQPNTGLGKLIDFSELETLGESIHKIKEQIKCDDSGKDHTNFDIAKNCWDIAHQLYLRHYETAMRYQQEKTNLHEWFENSLQVISQRERQRYNNMLDIIASESVKMKKRIEQSYFLVPKRAERAGLGQYYNYTEECLTSRIELDDQHVRHSDYVDEILLGSYLQNQDNLESTSYTSLGSTINRNLTSIASHSWRNSSETPVSSVTCGENIYPYVFSASDREIIEASDTDDELDHGAFSVKTDDKPTITMSSAVNCEEEACAFLEGGGFVDDELLGYTTFNSNNKDYHLNLLESHSLDISKRTKQSVDHAAFGPRHLRHFHQLQTCSEYNLNDEKVGNNPPDLSCKASDESILPHSHRKSQVSMISKTARSECDEIMTLVKQLTFSQRKESNNKSREEVQNKSEVVSSSVHFQHTSGIGNKKESTHETKEKHTPMSPGKHILPRRKSHIESPYKSSSIKKRSHRRHCQSSGEKENKRNVETKEQCHQSPVQKQSIEDKPKKTDCLIEDYTTRLSLSQM